MKCPSHKQAMDLEGDPRRTSLSVHLHPSLLGLALLQSRCGICMPYTYRFVCNNPTVCTLPPTAFDSDTLLNLISSPLVRTPSHATPELFKSKVTFPIGRPEANLRLKGGGV